MNGKAQRTVLITGIEGYWGQQVARRLLAQPGMRVLGIDRRAPRQVEAGVDFIKADVRNPLLADLLRVEQVNAVIHLAFRESQWRREQDFDSNVLGTLQLLGACAEAGVGQVVLKSSMAVYGARPENPMYLPEEWPLQARSSYGYVRDALEIERSVHELVTEYPELRVAVLRFPNVVGPEVTTPFTRLLRLPAIPSLLGFDPILQVIDAEDAVSALVQTCLVEAGGPFNVAADGVLSLCQLAGMVGRPRLPVFHLLLYWFWRAAAGLPVARRLLAWFPIELDYLRYSWTGDLARMEQVLGFQPQRDARASLQHFVGSLRARQAMSPAGLQRFADDHLEEAIAQRRQRRIEREASDD